VLDKSGAGKQGVSRSAKIGVCERLRGALGQFVCHNALRKNTQNFESLQTYIYSSVILNLAIKLAVVAEQCSRQNVVFWLVDRAWRGRLNWNAV
jgi:hypothetical protein